VTALGGAPVAPESVLAADPTTLRAAGLSANKLAAIIDLAAKFADGTIPTHDLDHLGDDEIVARLITVRGVGRWTAEMFLLFQLHRPDVWPVDDLGCATAGHASTRWRRRRLRRRSRSSVTSSVHTGAPRLVLLARGRLRADRGRPCGGAQAGAQSRGSTITFPPEEGVISSSNTSGT